MSQHDESSNQSDESIVGHRGRRPGFLCCWVWGFSGLAGCVFFFGGRGGEVQVGSLDLKIRSGNDLESEVNHPAGGFLFLGLLVRLPVYSLTPQNQRLKVSSR